MKKQLVFLYVLLFIFLSIIGYSCFLLFTMETEPETLPEFEVYEQIQEDVTTKEAPSDDTVYLDYNLEDLLNTNPDFDSWLMIPDTPISYPVVRTDDNFYYLSHDFSKMSSRYGCPYYDIASVPGSENRVIHGHNMGMNRTEIFSTLIEFQDQAYTEAHKIAYLSNAPDGAADIYEVYAVVNYNLDANPNFNHLTTDFDTAEEKADFIAYLQARSIYETDFVPQGKLLILSTCNRQYGERNRLLICLGEKIGENTPVESEDPA